MGENNMKDTEKAWADRLGMEYDPERIEAVEKNEVRLPPPVPQRPPEMPKKKDLHPEGPMPPSFMLWAVLSTLCCCMPAGIVAIVYSAYVSNRWFAGDAEGARRASRRVELWVIISIVAGIVINSLYLPLTLLLD